MTSGFSGMFGESGEEGDVLAVGSGFGAGWDAGVGVGEAMTAGIEGTVGAGVGVGLVSDVG